MRGRPNLEIRGGALVDRVLFEGTQATGVRVRFDGGAWQTIAGREVVLSAGAIHSPAILLRSGIGDAAQLQSLGIPVLRDQPSVGRHLMDHPIMRATLQLRPEPPCPRCGCPPHELLRHLQQPPRRRRRTRHDLHRLQSPDSGWVGTGTSRRGRGALYEAFSRGELHLASANPEVDPVVEENMLSDPRDRLRMRDAVRRLATLTAHPALTNISESIRLGDTPLTPSEAAVLPDADLDALMLQEAGDIQACRRYLPHDRL